MWLFFFFPKQPTGLYCQCLHDGLCLKFIVNLWPFILCLKGTVYIGVVHLTIVLYILSCTIILLIIKLSLEITIQHHFWWMDCIYKLLLFMAFLFYLSVFHTHTQWWQQGLTVRSNMGFTVTDMWTGGVRYLTVKTAINGGPASPTEPQC